MERLTFVGRSYSLRKNLNAQALSHKNSFNVTNLLKVHLRNLDMWNFHRTVGNSNRIIHKHNIMKKQKSVSDTDARREATD